jgi:hypothetical protein
VRFRELLCFGLLLLAYCNGIAQKPSKTNIIADTIPLTAPILSIVGGCEKGINLIEVDIDEEDTSNTFNTFILNKHLINSNPLDSLKDTVVALKVFTFDELQKRDFIIQPDKEGIYSLKVKQKKGDVLKESPLSKMLTVHYCSALELYNFFDKSKVQAYTPKKLFNIQVLEFNVFDRIGETVYLHKNNNIFWEGNYINGQNCPNGIYYYHCEYLDIADGNKKKSQSGMIELKNAD